MLGPRHVACWVFFHSVFLLLSMEEEERAVWIETDLGTKRMTWAPEVTTEEAEARTSVVMAIGEDRVNFDHRKTE